jgi:hypothetical protein
MDYSKLSQQDIFRDVLPGYIFLVVVLSFILPIYPKVLSESGVSINGLIGLVAGFPLGHIFQKVNRWWHGWKVRPKMEEKEAEIVRDWIGEKIIKNLVDGLKIEEDRVTAKLIRMFLNLFCRGKDRKEKEKNRVLSMAVELFINKECNACYKERFYNEISRMHSAGASCIAILIGILVAVTFYSFADNIYSFCFLKPPELVVISILSLIWVLIACIFSCDAEHSRKSHQYIMGNFIKIREKSIRDFFVNGDETDKAIK